MHGQFHAKEMNRKNRPVVHDKPGEAKKWGSVVVRKSGRGSWKREVEEEGEE